MAEWPGPRFGRRLLIALDCLMTFFGSTASTPTTTPTSPRRRTSHRGRGQSLPPGDLARLPHRLRRLGSRGEPLRLYRFFCAVGALVLALGLAGGLTSREAEPGAAHPGGESIRALLRRDPSRRNRDVSQVLLAMAVGNGLRDRLSLRISTGTFSYNPIASRRCHLRSILGAASSRQPERRLATATDAGT